jgi:hypothetical protein
MGPVASANGDPACQKHATNFGQPKRAKGPAALPNVVRCGERTPQRQAPLALAPLVLGSRRVFSRFFEISCCRFKTRSGDQRLISREAG